MLETGARDPDYRGGLVYAPRWVGFIWLKGEWRAFASGDSEGGVRLTLVQRFSRDYVDSTEVAIVPASAGLPRGTPAERQAAIDAADRVVPSYGRRA